MSTKTIKRAYADEESLMIAVLEAIYLRRSKLATDIAYTLEQLVGDALWKRLSDAERRFSGRAISHFVELGQLPLAYAGKRGATRLYRITGEL